MPSSHGPMQRLVRNVGGKLKTSLAVVGAAAVGVGYVQVKALFPDHSESPKVLVIPFHRLLLQDTPEQDVSTRAGRRLGSDRVWALETRELVDLIHAAAADPHIVGLYGVFGHGSVLPAAGWVDLEEVREALKVFQESHRVHAEPRVGVPNTTERSVARQEPKPMVAYADHFNAMNDPSNKEYYLASMFSQVHMQDQGELNLLGMQSNQIFVKDALQKYGIKLHVLKHGAYKNASNMFTEKKFNKPHREATASILAELQASVCRDITESRSQSLYAAWVKKNHTHTSNDLLWKRIFETGCFPAGTALKAGFVDSLLQRDPLPTFLKQESASDATLENTPKEFKFRTDKAISLASYKKLVDKRKQADAKRRALEAYLSEVPYIPSNLERLTGLFATTPTEAAPSESRTGARDKVALLHVSGAITDSTARRTVNALRQIGQDKSTKAIVLRVNSPGGSIFACETIAQELERLNLPVIGSFGNVAASGGYYISAKSSRIFASPKTLTGSIGVIGIRADLTELAHQYGVTSDSISTSPLAGLFSPLEPTTRPMQRVWERSIDRYYRQFKAIVGAGRQLDEPTVEAVAQGRVWTGEQARVRGLVDDTGGGLFRALAYAERQYTQGDAEIVVWPRTLGFWERLQEYLEEGDPFRLWASISGAKDGPTYQTPSSLEAVVQSLVAPSHRGAVPPTLAGVFLASDETTAVQCLLEQAMQPLGVEEMESYVSW